MARNALPFLVIYSSLKNDVSLDATRSSYRERTRRHQSWSIGLRRLYTRDCDWLFSSRRSMFWKSLVSLHTLTIDSCEVLRTFPEEFQGFKSLKSLVVMDCGNLIDFSPALPSSSTTIPIGLPPELEDLCIIECGGLKKMPRCPTSLKRLNILDCMGLTSLTEDIGQLTSLSRVYLLMVVQTYCPCHLNYNNSRCFIGCISRIAPSLNHYPKICGSISPASNP